MTKKVFPYLIFVIALIQLPYSGSSIAQGISVRVAYDDFTCYQLMSTESLTELKEGTCFDEDSEWARCWNIIDSNPDKFQNFSNERCFVIFGNFARNSNHGSGRWSENSSFKKVRKLVARMLLDHTAYVADLSAMQKAELRSITELEE